MNPYKPQCRFLNPYRSFESLIPTNLNAGFLTCALKGWMEIIIQYLCLEGSSISDDAIAYATYNGHVGFMKNVQGFLMIILYKWSKFHLVCHTKQQACLYNQAIIVEINQPHVVMGLRVCYVHGIVCVRIIL